MLVLVVGAVGLINLALLLAASGGSGSNPYRVGYRIGFVGGGMIVLPALVMGVCAIWRRLRGLRAQAIILLAMWSLSAFSHLNSVLVRSERPRVAPGTRASGLLSENSPATPPPQQASAPVDPTRKFEYRFDDHASAAPTGTPAGAKVTRASPHPRPMLTVDELRRAVSFDFSPGSAERLSRTVDSAQAERYREIVDAYAAACASRPDDADLAVERLRFIARFVDLEDNTIARASDDYEAALAYLNERFADAPVAALYILTRTYGAKFEEKAGACEPRVASWPDREAGEYWLLRAQRASRSRQRTGFIRDAAEKSFALHPTPESGILLARTLHEQKEDARAIEILGSSAFEREDDEIKSERMELLFDLRQNEAALRAYAVLKVHAPALLANYPTAMKLAAAGQVAAARETIRGLREHEWNAAQIARQRFEFELAYGDKAQAVAAYRALRAKGWNSDPLLRDRFSLLARFPSSGFFVSDLLGVAILLLIGAVVVAGFGLMLMPIHYWSLLRQRRGVTSAWELSPWGLRTVWFLLALTTLVALSAVWYLAPDTLLNRLGSLRERNGSALVPAMCCVWVTLSLAGAWLIFRGRALSLFGPGAWDWRTAIGRGVLVGGATWMAAIVYVLVVPGARPAISEITPQQLVMLKAAYGHAGSFGVLALIAGFVPIFEEFMLRGVMLGAYAKHLPWIVANGLQAVTFALLHDSVALLPFYIAFGYVAGELVRRSASLLPSILMHMTNNFLAGLVVLSVNAYRHILG